MKKENMNDKGFSLVELVIVIAIMAVLVGVLAPQFIKYVEQSRRSKDIQAAANLQTAYLTAIADQEFSSGDLGTSSAPVAVSTKLPSTVTETPTVSGTLTTATTFYVYGDITNGIVKIYIGTADDPDAFELTDETSAQNYKDA